MERNVPHKFGLFVVQSLGFSLTKPTVVLCRVRKICIRRETDFSYVSCVFAQSQRNYIRIVMLSTEIQNVSTSLASRRKLLARYGRKALKICQTCLQEIEKHGEFLVSPGLVIHDGNSSLFIYVRNN